MPSIGACRAGVNALAPPNDKHILIAHQNVRIAALQATFVELFIALKRMHLPEKERRANFEALHALDIELILPDPRLNEMWHELLSELWVPAEKAESEGGAR